MSFRKARSAATKSYNRMRIAELHNAGLTQKEIATELGISQATVSRDLGFLERQWAARAGLLTSQQQNAVLADLDWAKKEAQANFEQSKKLVVTAKGIVEADEKTKQILPGDPRYLSIFTDAVQKIIDMLGLKEAATIKLSPETIALMSNMGMDKSSVVKAFEEIIQQQANLQGQS